jgi:hypothetical protein
MVLCWSDFLRMHMQANPGAVSAGDTLKNYTKGTVADKLHPLRIADSVNLTAKYMTTYAKDGCAGTFVPVPANLLAASPVPPPPAPSKK